MVIVGSGFGLYYYLRVVFQMTRPAVATYSPVTAALKPSAIGSHVALGLLGLTILALGSLPSQLIEFLEALGESFRQY